MKIVLHPSRPIFASLLSNLGAHGNVTFDGDVFRFIHPQFSKPAGIVSGIGALHAAGRWNIAGSYRLSYTAVAPETALAEALAHVRYYNLPLSNALPRVLVALHLKASRDLGSHRSRHSKISQIVAKGHFQLRLEKRKYEYARIDDSGMGSRDC